MLAGVRFADPATAADMDLAAVRKSAATAFVRIEGLSAGYRAANRLHAWAAVRNPSWGNRR